MKKKHLRQKSATEFVLLVHIETPESDRIMNTCYQNTADSGALARCLTDRYGSLAMARAAGEAAYAERRGDRGRSAFLRGVINDLRRTTVSAERA